MEKEQGKNNIILWTIITLSIAGFIDASYLAMKKMIGAPVLCYGSSGCEIVDASVYSAIWGIPVALFGTVFYAVSILLLVQYLLRKQKRVLNMAVATLILGGLFAIYLLFLQAFVINAWCYYCVISDTIGVINALLIIYLIRTKK